MTTAIEPLLVDVTEAARMIGIKRSKFYQLLGDGELEVVRIGRAVRIPVAALRNYVDRIRTEQGPGA